MGVVDLSDESEPLIPVEVTLKVLLIVNGIVYTLDVEDSVLSNFLTNNSVEVANVA
jgi:hypothetical protein